MSGRRQVLACVDQRRESSGYFAALAGQARHTLPATVHADLGRGSHAAARSYDALASFLGKELLARAPPEDAVGRERYALMSRWLVGAEADLAEAYAWAQEELGGGPLVRGGRLLDRFG